MIHCKIENGAIVAREDKEPGFVKNGPDGLPVWRPFIESEKPEIIPDYQSLSHVDVIEETQVVRHYSITEIDIEVLRELYKRRVNSDAERIRLKYITAGDGQNLVYDQKAREARAALDDPSPTRFKYPVLAASIGTEIPHSGDEIADFHLIAKTVLDKSAQWAAIAGGIEAVRLSAKVSLNEAETSADVVAAYKKIVWPNA